MGNDPPKRSVFAKFAPPDPIWFDEQIFNFYPTTSTYPGVEYAQTLKARRSRRARGISDIRKDDNYPPAHGYGANPIPPQPPPVSLRLSAVPFVTPTFSVTLCKSRNAFLPQRQASTKARTTRRRKLRTWER